MRRDGRMEKEEAVEKRQLNMVRNRDCVDGEGRLVLASFTRLELFINLGREGCVDWLDGLEQLQ